MRPRAVHSARAWSLTPQRHAPVLAGPQAMWAGGLRPRGRVAVEPRAARGVLKQHGRTGIQPRTVLVSGYPPASDARGRLWARVVHARGDWPRDGVLRCSRGLERRGRVVFSLEGGGSRGAAQVGGIQPQAELEGGDSPSSSAYCCLCAVAQCTRARRLTAQRRRRVLASSRAGRSSWGFKYGGQACSLRGMRTVSMGWWGGSCGCCASWKAVSQDRSETATHLMV